jgi:hypothetical protein
MRRTAEDDSIAWIGYADFLTTVAILFIVLFAVAVAAQRTGVAVLEGRIEAAGHVDFTNCVVRLGDAQELRADSAGTFAFEMPDMAGPGRFRLDADCIGILSADTVVRMHPQDTTHLLLLLTKHPLADSLDSLIERIEILEDTVRILTQGYPLCASRQDVAPSLVSELTVVGLNTYRFGTDTLGLAELAARVRLDSVRAAAARCVHPMRVSYIRTLSAYDWQTSRASLAGLRYRTIVIGDIDR